MADAARALHKKDKVASASRQRQTTFELERHAFEANTLTQLFLILAKRKASWWKDSGSNDGGGDSAEKSQLNNHHATLPGDTTGGTLSPQRRGTRLPTASGDTTDQFSGSMNATRDALSMSTTKLSATLNDPKAMLKLRREMAAKKKLQRATTTAKSCSAPQVELPPALQIPDTVVWENNIPKGWFYYDQKEGHVARRKVETKQIQEAFLKEALFENDVVAVVYSVPSHQQHGDDGVDGAELLYRYLTAAELPLFLFENRRGKGTSILQKFVYPLNVQHNDCIQVVWSPSVTQVNRRQNIHDIFDERISPNDRCATFEGRTHLSRNVQCTPKLQERIAAVCKEFVKHFHETDAKHVVQRISLHVKITDTSDMVVLYCSSVRVMEAGIAAPLPLPSGSILTMTEPTNTSASQLQKKYRVSLELATRYRVKEVDESQALKGSKDSSGAPRQGRDSAHRAASPSPAASGVPGSHEGSPCKAVQGTHVQVLVGDRPAAHHGFVLRSVSPAPGGASEGRRSSSPRRGSLAAGGDGRLMSFRSSSADRLSLIGIVQDVIRVQEKDVPESQASKVRHLMQAAVKKAGLVAMRTALLQTRPNSELTEFEKMELLSLKLSEMERRRLRKSSSANFSPSPEHRSASRVGASSPTTSVSHGAPLRNVVFAGAHDTIPTDVEEKWSELCYAAQTFFDTVSFGSSASVFEFTLDGRHAAADAAVLHWLHTKKEQTAAVERIGHGITQLDGATLRFEMNTVASNPLHRRDTTGDWTPYSLVHLQIPNQTRAAQKLFHEAHHAMSSPDFARFVRISAARLVSDGATVAKCPPDVSAGGTADAVGTHVLKSAGAADLSLQHQPALLSNDTSVEDTAAEEEEDTVVQAEDRLDASQRGATSSPDSTGNAGEASPEHYGDDFSPE